MVLLSKSIRLVLSNDRPATQVDVNQTHTKDPFIPYCQLMPISRPTRRPVTKDDVNQNYTKDPSFLIVD